MRDPRLEARTWGLPGCTERRVASTEEGEEEEEEEEEEEREEKEREGERGRERRRERGRGREMEREREGERDKLVCGDRMRSSSQLFLDQKKVKV